VNGNINDVSFRHITIYKGNYTLAVHGTVPKKIIQKLKTSILYNIFWHIIYPCTAKCLVAEMTRVFVIPLKFSEVRDSNELQTLIVTYSFLIKSVLINTKNKCLESTIHAHVYHNITCVKLVEIHQYKLWKSSYFF